MFCYSIFLLELSFSSGRVVDTGYYFMIYTRKIIFNDPFPLLTQLLQNYPLFFAPACLEIFLCVISLQSSEVDSIFTNYMDEITNPILKF